MIINKRAKKCFELMDRIHIGNVFMASYLGVLLRTFQYWRTGDRKPSDEKIERMESILLAIKELRTK